MVQISNRFIIAVYIHILYVFTICAYVYILYMYIWEDKLVCLPWPSQFLVVSKPKLTGVSKNQPVLFKCFFFVFVFFFSAGQSCPILLSICSAAL